MDLTDLQSEIDNIIEEVEHGSTIDTAEEAERIFAMCDKIGLSVRRSAMNDVYDKFVKLNDQEAFKSWLNKQC